MASSQQIHPLSSSTAPSRNSRVSNSANPPNTTTTVTLSSSSPPPPSSPPSSPPPSLLPPFPTSLHDNDHDNDRDDDTVAMSSILAQPSTTTTTTALSEDHESDASDDRTCPKRPLRPHDLDDLDDDDDDDDDEHHLPLDASCVVCFERPNNITLDPCGHSNLCDVCVSRLVKRRCPTCRARARKVTIRRPGQSPLTKAVREVIAERKQRETRVLEDTLQIVFLGPEKVGKKTLVRKLISKFPASGAVDDPSLSHLDVFSDGTDFSANATIAGVNVRLTVLRRTTLTSRRMVLDDVRVLKPDVLVLCCSAHIASTFDTILSWDKVLRNNFQKPRVWALLTLDESDSTNALASPPPSIEGVVDVSGAIDAIFPPDLRPKGHYYCSPGEHFSIGFRSLPKDIVAMGRTARDEDLAASIALEEARTLADHEAAGTLSDHVAANLVIANNGIGVPSAAASSGGATAGAVPSRGSSNNGRHVGRSLFLRGLRSGNGQGISLSGLVNWLAGSHDS